MEVSRVSSTPSVVIARMQPYVSMVVKIALAALAFLRSLDFLVRRYVSYRMGRYSQQPPRQLDVGERHWVDPSGNWPKPLIDAIGCERFDKLSTLKVDESKLERLPGGDLHIALNPEDVPEDLMKVEDPLGRKGVCWVETRKASGATYVEIIYLRDQIKGRWFFGREGYTYPKPELLDSLKKKLDGTNKYFKLRNAES